jgi:very-short-patch-repair endonuclease
VTRAPNPLPRPLGSTPFSTSAAIGAGVSVSRLRAKDLEHPFVGVRMIAAPASVEDLAHAYAPILTPGEFFSHATAAVLHGMWLPLALEQQLLLDVSVRKPQRAPRDARVQGHHLVDRPGLVRTVQGLPVANPWETWAQLARTLSVTDLVVAGEALLAKGRSDRRAMLERLLDVAADPDRPFHRRLARAAGLLRIDSRSAAETRFRLLLTRSGLPEPRINVRIHDPLGRFIGEGDLVYLEEMVLVEYEGDGHRERGQFRRDISRVEEFVAAGWRVIRVTADDERNPSRLLAILTQALRDRRKGS